MTAYQCELKQGPVTASVCWLTRLSLGKRGGDASACGGCASRMEVNAARTFINQPIRACPVMMAEVPTAECEAKPFGKCETCSPAHQSTIAAPTPAAPSSPKAEASATCGWCSAPATVGRWGQKPALCAAHQKEWKSGNRSHEKPQTAEEPKKAPVISLPASALKVAPELPAPGAPSDAGIIAKMVESVHAVATDDKLPLDIKGRILLESASAAKNLSEVALIKARRMQ